MEIGVFIPIGSNGWLISTTSPQYKPSFELNKQITLNAERYGLDFVLSMIKLRGFGGKSEFWDHNLESFTLMAGLAAVTSRIKTLCHGADAGRPAGDRRAHGVDHRFDLQRAVRPQRHHRLATAGIFPDGPVAGRRVLRPPLPLRRRICPDPARPVGDGRVRLQGRLLHHERLPAEPPPQGRHEGHLRRPERRRPGVHRQVCRLQFLLRQGHQHAARLQRHGGPHAVIRRQDRPQGRLLRPLHGDHRRDRRRSRGEVGTLQGRRRPRGAGLAGRAGDGRQESDRRQQCAPRHRSQVDGQHQHRPAAGLACQGGADAGRDGDHTRPGRRAAHLRRVRERHRDLRRAHPAADAVPPPCRRHPPKAAA